MKSIKDIAFAKASLLACSGFQASFIDPGIRISAEKILPRELRQYYPEVEGNKKGVLHYTHLSVYYHSARRVPFLSAYNIDGGIKQHGIKRANGFRLDPRIDTDIQLSQKGFYDLRKDITEFEIGHMAANDELAWGKDGQLKAYQTFHFPNSVPQAENLNTGIWKALESYVIDEAISLSRNRRICVFTGPVLLPDDPAYIRDPDFRIPLLFYKVIVFPTAAGVRSTGFIMSHEQRMLDQNMFASRQRAEMLESGEGVGVLHFADFKYRKVFQVNLNHLEELTGLTFSWKNVKPIRVPQDKHQIMKIRKVRNSGDAAALTKAMRRGEFPQAFCLDEDLSTSEIRSKNYRLSLILG